MATSWQTLSEADFGGGIDQESPENKIKPTHVEDLLNMDATSEGILKKRTGYETYGGNLPFRVKQFEQTASPNQVCFTLDTSINLSDIRSTPIMVLGRLSAGTGDFNATEEKMQYYSEVTTDVRVSFPLGLNTTSLSLTDHDENAEFLFINSFISDSQVNFSNSKFYAQQYAFDAVTKQVDITVDNNIASAFSGFLTVQGKDVESTVTYATGVPSAAVQTTPYVLPNNSIHDFDGSTAGVGINGLEAALRNNNLGVKFFEVVGDQRIEFIPERVSVNASGNIGWTINNTRGSTLEYVVVATTAPDANVVSGTAGAGSAVTIPIAAGTNPFFNVYCWLEDINTQDLDMVIPDAVSYDAASGEINVTFTNNQIEDANFFVFWEVTSINVNRICATANDGAADVALDLSPQLTLWGLDHEGLYDSEAEEKAGWVQHIDTYRSTGERFLVAGLGGNLFRHVLRSAAEEDLPSAEPRLLNRADVGQRVGPGFTSNPAELRTRGLLQSADVTQATLQGSVIEYQESGPNAGTVRYLITATSYALQAGASALSDVMTPDQDYLTVTGAGYQKNQGEFLIKAVEAVDADSFAVYVLNPKVSSTDWNEQDSGARCGVFTDSISLLNIAEFLPGDTLTASSFSAGSSVEVVSAEGTSVVVRLVQSSNPLPAGQRIVSSRTTSIIPLSSVESSNFVEKFLLGDCINITGYTRQPRILSVNTRDNQNISITGNVVTMLSGDTNNLDVNETVLFYQCGAASGAQVITEVLNATQFTISNTYSGTITGVLAGYTILIDESLLVTGSANRSVSVSVNSRWYPIEAPKSDDSRVDNAITTYFDFSDYDNQTTLRSTMSANNLYFTNYNDEVLKYDGVSLYQAGFPRWQPALFTSRLAGGLVTPNLVSNITAIAGVSTARIEVANITGFAVGDYIEVTTTTDPEIHQIVQISEGATQPAGTLILNKGLASSVDPNDSVTKLFILSYYFRLSMIDANGNTIASAVTGASDFRVAVGNGNKVGINLIGMPTYSIYDYDKIELEIYRTRITSPAGPYYKAATIDLSFNESGYVYFEDEIPDEALTEFDRLSVLSGEELAQQLSQPFRAKYITSLDNRLVLGNVRTYARMTVDFEGSSLSAASFTGTRFLIRRDNTSTSTALDCNSTLPFEFVAAPTYSNLTINNSNVIGNEWQIIVPLAVSVGDWVYVRCRGLGRDVSLAGWHQVLSKPSPTTARFRKPEAFTGTAGFFNYDVFITPGFIPIPTGPDDNYFTLFSNVSPKAYMPLRIANAINTIMRNCEDEGFTPWILAGAGGEFPGGQLFLSVPKYESTSFEFEHNLNAASPGYSLFINGFRVDTTTQQARQSQIIEYPSRVLFSYRNYPELFDNPTGSDFTVSDSVVDVNSADGQEITGIIPFFGDSAFGAAQMNATLVVFKTNSIYLVNIDSPQPVQKLETNGLGCTAPYSISVTKQGIMFANESGIYRLTRNLSIQYIGSKVERLWETATNLQRLDLAQGHHYGVGRQYKLSYPSLSANQNAKVYVYNHTREEQGVVGGWTIYDNHPATGWANLGEQAFFASTKGRVFRLRNAKNASDFRDDAEAIGCSVTLRALDFGDGGIRKYINNIVAHFRNQEDLTSTKVSVALDLRANFTELDGFNIDISKLSGTISQKVTSIKFDTNRSKFNYIQLRFTNAAKDEPMEITSVDFRVAGLNSKGLTDAALTAGGS